MRSAAAASVVEVVFNAAAHTAGFVDVAFTALPASPIVITVPGAAPAGTYNGTLTVKTTATAYAWYAILKYAYPGEVRWRQVWAAYAACVALNFVLIPRSGAVGSAVASLVSHACSSWLSNAVHPRTRPIFFMQLRSLDPRRLLT